MVERMGLVAKQKRHDDEVLALSKVFEVFKKYNVQIWLDQGTLLGLYRDNRLLPVNWDHDIDLGVWLSSYQKARFDLVRELSELGWQTRQLGTRSLCLRPADVRCRPLSIAFYISKDDKALKYYCPSNKSLIWKVANKIARFFEMAMVRNTKKSFVRYKNSHPYIILFSFYCILFKWQFFYRMHIQLALFFRMLTFNNLKINIECPIHHFQSLDDFIFQEKCLLIPTDTKGYLEFKYGKTWRVPRKKWNFLEDDGGVRNE